MTDSGFDQFLRLLRDGHLDRSPIGLAATLAGIDDAHRAEAIKLALEWIQHVWRSDGAWDALWAVPPMALTGHSVDSQALMKLLNPEQRRRLSVDRELGYWDWQRDMAETISNSLIPQVSVARQLWTERIARHRHLQGIIDILAKDFVLVVELGRDDPQLREYETPWNHQRFNARMGEPDCGHVRTPTSCDRCWWSSEAASEAHYGWAASWKPIPTDSWNAPDPAACLCCASGHDIQPRGTPRCLLCAEALFYARSRVRARGYGGWSWLTAEMLSRAIDLALTERADLVPDARSLGFTRESNTTSLPEEETEPNPWTPSSSSYRALATFIIPVAIYPTDLSKDVKRRLTRTYDALWKRLLLRNPKSTGKTQVRHENWTKYLDWLWRHRVEGQSIEAITGDYTSPVAKDEVITVRTVRNGIAAALRALSA